MFWDDLRLHRSFTSVSTIALSPAASDAHRLWLVTVDPYLYVPLYLTMHDHIDVTDPIHLYFTAEANHPPTLEAVRLNNECRVLPRLDFAVPKTTERPAPGLAKTCPCNAASFTPESVMPFGCLVTVLGCRNDQPLTKSSMFVSGRDMSNDLGP
jgi:hypothetical protein